MKKKGCSSRFLRNCSLRKPRRMNTEHSSPVIVSLYFTLHSPFTSLPLLMDVWSLTGTSLPVRSSAFFCSAYSTNRPNADVSLFSCVVQEPDPNQPKPEGQQMNPLEGEHLGMVNKWPSSLPAALHRWGTTQPKSPCLTALDNAGKPVYTLTYGR